MSAIGVLVGLLFAAYAGSMWMGGRRLRGHGLPSGSEWLVVGFVIGPSMLGLVSRDALVTFEPAVGVAVAWLALVCGAEYGYAGDHRIELRRFVAGIACALLSAVMVGSLVYYAARTLTTFSPREAAMLAAGIGLASCETARYALRWAAEHGADSPLLVILAEIADTDEVVPLLGLSVLFVFTPGTTTLALLPVHWLGVTAGLGVLLGLTCAVLLRYADDVTDAWGVVLGAAWLGTGIAWRLGLSAPSVLFLLGVSMCAVSRHGRELRRMLQRSEDAVVVPTLLMAGALARVPATQSFAAIVIAALIARGLARSLIGAGLGAVANAPAGTRWPLSLGFWSTGMLSPLVALACALRFRDEVGELILTAGCAMTVAGELVGPLFLRRALATGTRPEPPASAEPAA
jgi:hypothetical protein